MSNETVMVESRSDMTLVVNLPDIPLQRVWKKRGAKYPFDRRILTQAYYDPSVEYLFSHGLLFTDDKEFLINVGLMEEETQEVHVYDLNEAKMRRMIGAMPLTDLKKEISEMSGEQINELCEYAIAHYTDMKMDKVDYLSKVSGKNINRSIENFKAAQED